MNRSSPRRDWLALWILWSAWCAISGWVLSALGQLDRVGYAVSIVLLILGIVLKRRFWESPETRPLFLARRSTYAHLLPKAWLGLALLALIGGLLYHPDNYDYLTYRLQRLLMWCAAHRWHWIPVYDIYHIRQNTSAVGMEWLMAPLFALFQTDRLFFLINFVSFLFLPGLIFSVFRRLGISGRIAWWWMWILPTGYCYLLQAASMGNDSFAAVYFLAALYYAFRADERSPQSLVLSLLAIALVTGAKPSNVPLVLPWLAVLWLQRGPVLASVRPLLLAGTCLVAAVCSFLPIALANIHYTGSYTGDPGNQRKLQVLNPVSGFAGNAVEFTTGNLLPPMWPHEVHWPFQEEITRLIHPGSPRFGINTFPFQLEEVSGVGVGITALAILGIIYGAAHRRRRSPATFWLATTTLLAWLAYMTKMSGEDAPRLIAAYYTIGIAAWLLLLPPEGRVIRHFPWRAISWATIAAAYLVLIIYPSRPLLPVGGIVGALRVLHAPAAALAKLETNYTMRASRRDGLAPLRLAIPVTEKIVGCVSGGDDPVISLWLPFGSRQVVDINPVTADLAARNIRYVAVNETALETTFHLTLADLQKKWNATLVQETTHDFESINHRSTWCLLHVPAP